MNLTNLDGFAEALAIALAAHADLMHDKAYKAYRLHDCDDDLYDEVERWSRLCDAADEAEIETGDILLERGAWRAGK